MRLFARPIGALPSILRWRLLGLHVILQWHASSSYTLVIVLAVSMVVRHVGIGLHVCDGEARPVQSANDRCRH